MRADINRAKTMLFRAGVTPLKDADVGLLAADIVGVAAELAGETGDPGFYITDGARELERRIGGIEKLPSYLNCLRGAKRSAA